MRSGEAVIGHILTWLWSSEGDGGGQSRGGSRGRGGRGAGRARGDGVHV